MKINKKKSGIMLFKRKTGNNRIILDDELKDYPLVTKYKYLGVYIDDKMSMQHHIQYIENKLEKSLKMVKILKWKNTTI